MGEVYRAQDTRLNRLVAIKVLPAPSATRTESRERFEREARAISSFSHPTSAACTTSTEHLSSLPIEILVNWPALLSHAPRP